mmetsp:Transcript_8839/g.14183  ORF Transcript_8839/g.14183 Transcript_8839/m.14183 type:complete len:274 (+) Transcript_8839:292-1113(+)
MLYPHTTETRQRRVLIIGSYSSDKIGCSIIHSLAELPARDKPTIFAFSKSHSGMDQFTKERCNKVIQGDSRNEEDLFKAMQKARADVVIFASEESTVHQDSPSQSQVALNSVLQRPMYRHVNLLLLLPDGTEVSSPRTNRASNESDSSRIKKGVGLGTFLHEGILSFFWSSVGSLTPSVEKQGTKDSELSFWSSPLMKDRIKILRPSSCKNNNCISKRRLPSCFKVAPLKSTETTSSSPFQLEVEKDKLADFAAGFVVDGDKFQLDTVMTAAE